MTKPKQPQIQPQTAVTYCRVSTDSQGSEGLGIEAQRTLIARYLAEKGLTIEKEFVEVQSGADDDRPLLAEALRLAKSRGLALVVAKQDRLSRNADFALQLFKRHRIIVAESPNESPLSTGVKALVSDYERVQIANRTKQALEELFKRAEALPAGGLLVSKRNRTHRKTAQGMWVTDGIAGERAKFAGNPQLATLAVKGGEGRRAKADSFALSVRPILVELFSKGKLSTSPELADALNARGIRPANYKSGKKESRWHPSGVRNVLARLDRLGQGVALVAVS